MHHTKARAEGISLRDQFPGACFFGADDIRITSCSAHAADCRPGDLYVALLLDDYDGHQEVDLAVRKGARAILAEHPVASDVPVCVVDDSREALGQLCHALSGQPSQHLRLIGVTGSHGKTVTNVLLSSIFAEAGQTTGWSNSISWSDASDEFPSDGSSPMAPVVCNRLTRMLRRGCTHAVVEVNSRALAQRSVASLQMDAVVLTNLQQEHLDLHATVENYRRATMRIFNQLKPHGFAAINADDDASQKLLGSLPHPVITYGMREPAEVTAQVLERHPSEQTFLLTAGQETIPVRTSIIGDQHVYNCLAATAVGLVTGLDLATIVRGLERVASVPGRLERIECGQPFNVYVDAARTPDKLAAALKAIRRSITGRIWCVMGAEGECRQSLRPLLGRVLERAAEVPLLTSDDPRGEPPLQIIHDMLDGFDRAERAWVRPDREGAIRWALQRAQPGDAVLIAGKGDRDYQAVGPHVTPFDDRQVARQILFEHGAEQLRDEEPVILPFPSRAGRRRAG